MEIEFGNFADLFFLSDILTENNHHGSSSVQGMTVNVRIHFKNMIN